MASRHTRMPVFMQRSTSRNAGPGSAARSTTLTRAFHRRSLRFSSQRARQLFAIEITASSRTFTAATAGPSTNIPHSRLVDFDRLNRRSEEHTSELQSLMRISYAVFCLKKTKHNKNRKNTTKTYTIYTKIY